jgi:hypothetical protein
LTPARSAGLPRMTPEISVPSLEGMPKESARSGVMAWTSTPIQPRVTDPLWMICSITLRARDTGIAKPMPSEPPVRE